MVAFMKQAIVLIGALALTQARPQGASYSLGSLEKSWTTKRALYNLDNVSDKGHKDKLTQALKDAVKIASTALDKMDDEKHRDKLAGWFGDQNSDDNARETIKQVFKNFVGDTGDETGGEANGKVLIYDEDYWKPTNDEIPGMGADGTIPFCKLTKDGKTSTAYYKRNDRKPAMHYCDKVWDRKSLSELTEGDCGGLGDKASTNLWTKQFLGANVLHEFMHYPKIGRDAVGDHIRDYAYDAFGCRSLALDDDVEKKKKTIVNADTYVWFALHIGFSELCGRSFSYPRNERDDDPTNQDWPSFVPEEEDEGTCDCDESGCTDDSAACCASGTC